MRRGESLVEVALTSWSERACAEIGVGHGAVLHSTSSRGIWHLLPLPCLPALPVSLSDSPQQASGV